MTAFKSSAPIAAPVRESDDAYIKRVLAMSPDEIAAEAEAVGIDPPEPRSLPASLRNLRFRLEAALANRLEEGDREAVAWLNEGVITIGAAIASLAAPTSAVQGDQPRNPQRHGCSMEGSATLNVGYPAYAAGADTLPTSEVPVGWPWEPSWWKPGTPRRMLVKAAALILAEIERLDRKSSEADNCSGPKPSDSSRPSYRNDFRYTG